MAAGTPASGKGVKAVLPGGRSSGFLTAADLDVPMDRQPLFAKSSSLGCGVIQIVEEGECIVEVVNKIAEFFSVESCGQCPGAQWETSNLAKIMSTVAAGTANEGMLAQVPKLAAFAKGKGFCSLLAMPLLTSALRDLRR